jgi:hypothetical protein
MNNGRISQLCHAAALSCQVFLFHIKTLFFPQIFIYFPIGYDTIGVLKKEIITSASFDFSLQTNEQIGQLRRNELVGILNTARPFNGGGYFQVKVIKFVKVYKGVQSE